MGGDYIKFTYIPLSQQKTTDISVSPTWKYISELKAVNFSLKPFSTQSLIKLLQMKNFLKANLFIPDFLVFKAGERSKNKYNILYVFVHKVTFDYKKKCCILYSTK